MVYMRSHVKCVIHITVYTASTTRSPTNIIHHGGRHLAGAKGVISAYSRFPPSTFAYRTFTATSLPVSYLFYCQSSSDDFLQLSRVSISQIWTTSTHGNKGLSVIFFFINQIFWRLWRTPGLYLLVRCFNIDSDSLVGSFLRFKNFFFVLIILFFFFNTVFKQSFKLLTTMLCCCHCFRIFFSIMVFF